MAELQTRPSPDSLPVRAASTIAASTASAISSFTTKVRTAFGRKRDSNTRPRYSCVMPRWRPCPTASTTVTPTCPVASSTASITVSMRSRRTTASTFTNGCSFLGDVIGEAGGVAAPPVLPSLATLGVVVQAELGRVRAERHVVDLVLPLPCDPGLDQVLAEHAALEQEVVVGLQRVDRLGQRPRNLRDVVCLLEQVEVGGLSGVETLLDAVEASHQHGREGQVRVRHRIRAAELEPLGLRRVGVHRDADARRAVALRVHEVDRRLVARHQPAVRVGRRGAEREERRRMLEQSADVRAGELRETRVAALVCEEGRALLPERLVRVHARAVVAEDRLRHERDALAVAARDVPDDVLVDHDLIRHLQQAVEAEVDLALTGGRHLVVVELALDADLLQLQHHLGADVLERVVRRGREVAVLLADRVARRALAVRVPVALAGLDLVAGRVRVAAVADGVEDEELALRADEAGVRHAGRLEVRLGAPGDLPRILVVALARDRVADLAHQREGRLLREGVEDRGPGLRDEQHVRLCDALPAADRGAVEAEALVEVVPAERADRQRDVLPCAEEVAELQVDHLRRDRVRDLQRRLRRGFGARLDVPLGLKLRHLIPSHDVFVSDHKKSAQSRQSSEAPLPRRGHQWPPRTDDSALLRKECQVGWRTRPASAQLGATTRRAAASQRQAEADVTCEPPIQRSTPRRSTLSASPRRTRAPMSVTRSAWRAKWVASPRGGGAGSGSPPVVSTSRFAPCPSPASVRWNHVSPSNGASSPSCDAANADCAV